MTPASPGSARPVDSRTSSTSGSSIPRSPGGRVADKPREFTSDAIQPAGGSIIESAKTRVLAVPRRCHVSPAIISVALSCRKRAARSTTAACPSYGRVHGDYQSQRLKNTGPELAVQDQMRAAFVERLRARRFGGRWNRHNYVRATFVRVVRSGPATTPRSIERTQLPIALPIGHVSRVACAVPRKSDYVVRRLPIRTSPV